MKKWFTLLNAKWCLVRGYLKHMSGDKTLLSSFTPKNGGFVSNGDNK